MSKKKSKRKSMNDPIANRLDALIRLLIEINKPKNAEEFSESTAARILKSAGLEPTEVAKILGKKSRTDIAPYLYPKKKARTTRPIETKPTEEKVEQK